MWTAQELTKVAKIVEKYNLWIISDEIHCDLIRKNNKHIPMGKIMKDYKKLITCMSASKTFNMAFQILLFEMKSLEINFRKKIKMLDL